MDELRSGSHADSTDLSKTFDTDETFNKIPHSCGPTREVHYLPIGSTCPRCKGTVKKKA